MRQATNQRRGVNSRSMWQQTTPSLGVIVLLLVAHTDATYSYTPRIGDRIWDDYLHKRGTIVARKPEDNVEGKIVEGTVVAGVLYDKDFAKEDSPIKPLPEVLLPTCTVCSSYYDNNYLSKGYILRVEKWRNSTFPIKKKLEDFPKFDILCITCALRYKDGFKACPTCKNGANNKVQSVKRWKEEFSAYATKLEKKFFDFEIRCRECIWAACSEPLRSSSDSCDTSWEEDKMARWHKYDAEKRISRRDLEKFLEIMNAGDSQE